MRLSRRYRALGRSSTNRGNSSQTRERPPERDRAIAARGAKPDFSDTRTAAGGRRPTVTNGGQGAPGRRGNGPEGFTPQAASLAPAHLSWTWFPGRIPVGFDAPVIAEVTIISREANVTFSNGAILAVLNARVDKVIKGTLEGSALKVVTYLDSCTTIGFGHGFIAGAMRHDPQRGFELLAIHQPQLHTRPRP